MPENKIALITGINGQDGSYLAEFLIEKGYEVHGTLKRNSVAENQTSRLEDIYDKVKLHYADLTDLSSLISVIQKVSPDEIYNLAAQSHVRISFDQPLYTANVTGIGTLNMLEAVKLIKPNTKIYQASSSEMFGNSIDDDGYQRETTPMNPVSPYGCAKVFSYNICKNYRNSYNMFISNGILFNHESERRGETFVTRKITLSASRIKHGIQEKLYLGNLDALRDWGYAKDYVECMWLMLQQEQPEDYVIATGIQYSVRYFCELAFKEAGIEIEWQGENENERGICKATGKVIIEVDPNYYRPAEVESLLGDPTKAKTQLGWNPSRTSIEQLVKIMMQHDLNYVVRFKDRDSLKKYE